MFGPKIGGFIKQKIQLLSMKTRLAFGDIESPIVLPPLPKVNPPSLVLVAWRGTATKSAKMIRRVYHEGHGAKETRNPYGV
jgi:hypothetical protein